MAPLLLLLADTFSELGRTLLHQVERFPHGRDAPNAYFHFFAYTNPAYVLLPLAAAGLLFMTARRWGKQTAFAAVCVFIGSFFVLASGRAVIRAAINLPLGDRPSCIAEAVVHGAVWDAKQLKNAPSCKSHAIRKHIATARDIVDSGADGTLAGPLVTDSWRANVSAHAPDAAWEARSVDVAGSRDVYLETAARAFRVSACPSLPPSAEKYSKRDHTGVSTVSHFAELAVRSQFRLFVTSWTRSITRSSHAHVYRFVDSAGRTTGYLLPAQGAFGECAVMTGPYVRRGVHQYALLRHPPDSALSLMDLLVAQTDVVGVASTTGAP